MRAYKFRGSEQVHFALDIILNSRLYCADWKTLNDPMEGFFTISYRDDDEYTKIERDVIDIIEEKKKLKVCSLSSTFDSHLLWAHYASGFSGLAIEVDLPENSASIKKVSYRGGFSQVNFNDPVDHFGLAETILSEKDTCWSYEKEFRVLQQVSFYQLEAPVKRVICGHRMNPALFEGIKIICKSKGIPVFRTGIGDMGIDADDI